MRNQLYGRAAKWRLWLTGQRPSIAEVLGDVTERTQALMSNPALARNRLPGAAEFTATVQHDLAVGYALCARVLMTVTSREFARPDAPTVPMRLPIPVQARRVRWLVERGQLVGAVA